MRSRSASSIRATSPSPGADGRSDATSAAAPAAEPADLCTGANGDQRSPDTKAASLEEQARQARINAALRQLVTSHCTGAETSPRGCTGAEIAATVDCTGAEDARHSAPSAEPAVAPDAPDAELRRRALDRDGWVCTIPGCGARTELQVDHVLPRARFPALRSEEANLTILCASCLRVAVDDAASPPVPEAECLWSE